MKTNKRNNFSQQGGFAKCFEVTDAKTGGVFAGKVVPKRLLVRFPLFTTSV